MSHLSPRSTRLTLIGLPLALVASGLMISQASYSAFSASTENAKNNWTTGSVTLTDDDKDAALFSAKGLIPGSTGENCIAVTSTSNVASTVKMYVDDVNATGGLGDLLHVSVTQGDGGGFGSCDGFTPVTADATLFDGSFGALSASDGFSSGLGSWQPKGDETRVYKISYSLDPNATNTAQAATAGVDFVWEAQND